MLEWHDLNARHEATFLWIAVVLLFVTVASSQIRNSIWDIFESMLEPYIWLPLVGLFANVAALSTLVVILGRGVGLWETLPIVTAIIWTLTTGFSLLLHIGDFFDNRITFRTKAIQVVVPSTIITEIVSVAIFQLWLEIILLPALFVLTLAMYSKRETGSPIVLTIMLLMYPLGLVSLLIMDFIDDPETWRPVIQAVVFPIVLTMGALVYFSLLLQIERLRFSIGAKRRKITASQYGSEWPLTVDSAKLCCRHNAVWVEVRGKKYGINGTSKSLLEKRGHQCSDIQEIWKDHPEVDGLKVNIGRLIQDGLALCQ